MRFDNRVTRLLGVEIPIVQAPMGWIARSRLASAVSGAGALGIIETSSGELDAVRGESEVAGRIEPVAEIVARTVREFFETVERLGKSYPAR